MSRPPDDLLQGLSETDRAKVEAWWHGLDEDEENEFSTLWDARAEDTTYCATVVDGRTEWHELPITLRAYPAGTASEKENALWKRQLGEYINGHEVQFFLAERRFHICRAHACARRVGETGLIPRDFVCPFADGACPFEGALDAARKDGSRRALWLVPFAVR